jgi:type IV pilus assembly protein PilQ
MFKYLIIWLSVSVLFSAQVKNKETVPTITLHAEEAKLSIVLAVITEMSGYNIVTGPSVSAVDNITIHLVDVNVEQAVNLVVRAAGLSYEIVDGSILVASPNKLKDDVGVSPVVFDLKYTSAIEISSLLSSITENITIDSTGNRILVNASPKKIAEINHIINEIDKPALQISLRARLIEVTYSDEENIGIDWARLAKISAIVAENAAPITFPDGSSTGSRFPGYQFVNEGEGSNLGFNYETQAEEFPLNDFPDLPYANLTDPIQGFSRQLTAFDVTIDMLLKNNTAEILANSEVVTLNGHVATISMVDVIPYILSSGGVGGQVQVQREEVGIKLRILPTVNSDGYITTHITPEVSSIYDFIGPDRNIPWVKKRISTTTVRVKDNESIIIAGLYAGSKILTENKVPLLWRIPFIGKWLFVHKVEKVTKTDLIIEITPRIISDNYSFIEKKKYHADIETNFLESGKEPVESPDINLEIDGFIELEEETPDTIKLINAVPDSLKEEVKELKFDEDE